MFLRTRKTTSLNRWIPFRHFAQSYKDAALHVLSHSHHPKYGYECEKFLEMIYINNKQLLFVIPLIRYSFAIVGINLVNIYT